MNPVSIRLLNQQLVAPQFSKPEEVVAHFGAMQAQEYRMMRWAVEMRTKRPSQSAFKKAFDEGKIVRLHLLRGTWQLVAADDYWWMLDLCAPKTKQVINGWMSANKIKLQEDEIREIRKIIVDTTERLGSATKEDFADALSAEGIVLDNHRLSYHIRYAELDGTLCSGDLLPMKATYAIAHKKMKPAEKKKRDEMLMLLAQKYFQSHQPATLEDFAWWSGLGVNDCKKAIELLSDSIHALRYKGREFYLLDDCRTRGFRKGNHLLIPPYDEYLIGYKSRDLVLNPEHKHHAHNNSGIFQPVIACDGIICGNWTPFKKNPETTFFTSEHSDSQLSRAIEAYQHFNAKK